MQLPFFKAVTPAAAATVDIFVRCTRCKGKYVHHFHPTRAAALDVQAGGWLQVDVCADCLTGEEAKGAWLHFRKAPCQPAPSCCPA